MWVLCCFSSNLSLQASVTYSLIWHDAGTWTPSLLWLQWTLMVPGTWNKNSIWKRNNGAGVCQRFYVYVCLSEMFYYEGTKYSRDFMFSHYVLGLEGAVDWWCFLASSLLRHSLCHHGSVETFCKQSEVFFFVFFSLDLRFKYFITCATFFFSVNLLQMTS